MMRIGVEDLAVQCRTPEEADQFMWALEQHTMVRWRNGEKPTEYNACWGRYEEKTTYTIEGNRMSFGNGEYPYKKGMRILPLEEFLIRIGAAPDNAGDAEVDLSALI